MISSQNKRLIFFTKLLLLLSLASYGVAHGQTNVLSGVISMPQGVVPVSQSVVYRVSTVPLDTFEMGGQSRSTFTEVSIPIASSSANYSITLPNFTVDSPNQSIPRKLKFECISGCQNIAITTVGYWGAGLGVVSEKDAAEFNAAISQSINLAMKRADFFAGTIILPEGVSASGAEIFTLTVRGSDFFNPASFSHQISTQENDTRWNFSIGVPPDSTLGSWLMSLSCEACDEIIPIGPYYPSTQGGDPLVTDSSGQFFFRKNRVYSNVRLTLPAPPPVEEPNKFNAGPLLLLLEED